MIKAVFRDHRLLLITVLIVLAAAAIAIFTWQQRQDSGEQRQDSSNNQSSDLPAGGEVSLSGEFVCLPHKDTDGPQTMECAFGLKTDDGTYYGLHDTSGDYSQLGTLPTGTRITVHGTNKPEQSDKYQSIGVVSVREVVRR